MVAAFDLTDRVALVTGAGSPDGIGSATARLLAEMGASVLVSSTSGRIHQRAAELCALGANAVGAEGDLTDPRTSVDLVDSARRHFGRLDVVVQCAGMTSVSRPEPEAGTVQEMDPATWSAGISRNLDSSFFLAKACLPMMTSQGWGRIVMVASVTGPIMAMRAEPAYAAAKAGVVGLVRALAVDTAHHGVTVNAVAPGWIATGSQTANERAQGKRTPMRRSADPAEVAGAIGWLCSPSASYVTGQCLVVDGGNSIAEERE